MRAIFAPRPRPCSCDVQPYASSPGLRVGTNLTHLSPPTAGALCCWEGKPSTIIFGSRPRAFRLRRSAAQASAARPAGQPKADAPGAAYSRRRGGGWKRDVQTTPCGYPVGAGSCRRCRPKGPAGPSAPIASGSSLLPWVRNNLGSRRGAETRREGERGHGAAVGAPTSPRSPEGIGRGDLSLVGAPRFLAITTQSSLSPRLGVLCVLPAFRAAGGVGTEVQDAPLRNSPSAPRRLCARPAFRAGVPSRHPGGEGRPGCRTCPSPYETSATPSRGEIRAVGRG